MDQAVVRAIPGFDHSWDSQKLSRVVLTTKMPRVGPNVVLAKPRSDLDEALEPPLGWHWFQGDGDLECRLQPTDDEIIKQIAADIAAGKFKEVYGDIETHAVIFGNGMADYYLRKAARQRMAYEQEETSHLCSIVLDRYQRWKQQRLEKS